MQDIRLLNILSDWYNLLLLQSLLHITFICDRPWENIR